MNSNNRLIFDLGAHNGLDSKIYLNKGYRVVAIEPNPYWVSKLRDLGCDNNFLIEECALSYDKQVNLFIPEAESSSCWATTSEQTVEKLNEYGVPLKKKVAVQGKTLDDLFSEHGIPYYIKCDIEGGDVMFIKMLSESKSFPKYVSFEIPTTYEEMKVCIDRLTECGYSKFWLSDQRLHSDKQVGMNSGPFGEEVPSEKYIDSDVFLRQAKKVIFMNSIIGNFSPIEKMKARRIVKMLEKVPVIGKYFYTSWYDCHAVME